jgi:hypothetical protein
MDGALNGGYFVARQFTRFVGVEWGKPASMLRLEGELPVFSFVDSDNGTESAFATFLRSHRRLFSPIPSFRLDFVGTRWSRFGRASVIFENVLSKGCIPGVGEREFDRLVRHFEERNSFESGGLKASIEPVSTAFATNSTSSDRPFTMRFSGCGRRKEPMRSGAKSPIEIDRAVRSARSSCRSSMGWLSPRLERRCPNAGGKRLRDNEVAPHGGGRAVIEGSGQGRERPRFRWRSSATKPSLARWRSIKGLSHPCLGF